MNLDFLNLLTSNRVIATNQTNVDRAAQTKFETEIKHGERYMIHTNRTYASARIANNLYDVNREQRTIAKIRFYVYDGMIFYQELVSHKDEHTASPHLQVKC